MVTTLLPLRVMTRVRWPRSILTASILAPVASETRSPFRASSEISACSAGDPSPAATSGAPSSFRSRSRATHNPAAVGGRELPGNGPAVLLPRRSGRNRRRCPATAVILAVTRQYSSTVLNFAAHSPEDANATENAILRASNGPDRRDRSSTERRLLVHLASHGRSRSVIRACEADPPRDRSYCLLRLSASGRQGSGTGLLFSYFVSWQASGG